ncbi:MAG: hypothetical protein DELT_00968 [Desulfovibrio sp.]
MRISQRQMYSQYTGHMQSTLGDLMESNNQSGTGKRINRPSDDPAGMARVMMFRQSLNNITQYKTNIGEAQGWLGLADNALMQVSEVISQIKTLDLQAATGTMSDDNRDQNAIQLRGYLGQLLNLANEKYNGQHIFAGHKVDKPAYQEALGVSCRDDAMSTVDFVATGGTATSTVFQFIESTGLDSTPRFIFSQDGGKTWAEGSWSSDGKTMQANGIFITPHLKEGVTPPMPNVTSIPVSGALPAFPMTATEAAELHCAKETSPGDIDTGTWFIVRPTAVYVGDDHDTQVTQNYGPPVGGKATAEGYFTRDVNVRIVAVSGTEIEYEYSLDGGSNWTPATAPAGADELAITGGYLKIDAGAYAAGQEFYVHPRRADINVDISGSQSITVNNVGKDIFGGLYQEPFTGYPTVVEGMPNLFEAVGKVIGYLETNDQEGIQAGLDELDECLKHITTALANVGARENRLEVAYETAVMREYSEETGRSSIEDVDTITLMTKLAQQQLAYNSVLKSSSMIMQMSLMNFI